MSFFCSTKNSYLQRVTGDVNPRLLNRAVDEAMCRETPILDGDPGLFRLASNQPCIPVAKSDFTCRELAFGRWAMPKLRRELHSTCPEIVNSAVNTLMEVIHDPEKTIEAINLDMVKRLADLMCHKDPLMRERICIILRTICEQERGIEACCNYELILTNLLNLLDDPALIVAYKAVLLCETMCQSWMACYILISYDYIDVIHSLIQRYRGHPHIGLSLLRIFRKLMTGEGKNIAFALGAFDTMVSYLTQSKHVILTAVIYCVSILLTLKQAKKRAVEINLLERLLHLLQDYRSDVYTAAAEAVMYATHRTKAKKQSATLQGLLDRLLILAHDKMNPRAQMYALRALTNLAEYPPNREYLLKYHKERIDILPVNWASDMPQIEICKFKETFKDVVLWKPSVCIPKKEENQCLDRVQYCRKNCLPE